MNKNYKYPTTPQKFQSYLSARDVQLDILLDLICEKLQLDKTREKRLQSAYDNISNCIEEGVETKIYDALVYYFGSRALNTVVKPVKRTEYDLDMVLQLQVRNLDYSPKVLRNEVFTFLEENSALKDKVEYFRYGVKVKYKGDFHVDIMIGFESDFGRLLVYDFKKNQYVNRNPKGYINWFESKYITNFQDIKLYPYYEKYFSSDTNYIPAIHGRIEKEEIKPAVAYQYVQPIQRITQLIKRHKNIYFSQNMNDYETSSVILTTLIGDSYQNETSIYDGMTKFINFHLNLINQYSKAPFKLINPADRNLEERLQENLTNKWFDNPKYHIAFKHYIRKLKMDWSELHDQTSIRSKAIFLQRIFGENVVDAAYQTLNNQKKSNGIQFDNKPLPFNHSQFEPSDTALANATKSRKPYYAL